MARLDSFQRKGLSLQPEGFQDPELMAFQGQERGAPFGLEICWNLKKENTDYLLLSSFLLTNFTNRHFQIMAEKD